MKELCKYQCEYCNTEHKDKSQNKTKDKGKAVFALRNGQKRKFLNY